VLAFIINGEVSEKRKKGAESSKKNVKRTSLIGRKARQGWNGDAKRGGGECSLAGMCKTLKA